MIGHSKPTMTDTIRNALREAKAEARSAQRFGERITFQYVVTDPVIVDYHHACIHADYDLSAAVLAGHTYTIGKTMLVGRFENTKKDRLNYADWSEKHGEESAQKYFSNEPILISEIHTDKAIGYASSIGGYNIICAAVRTDGITYYGNKGFAHRFAKRGNQVGDGRHIITSIFNKNGNSKKPFQASVSRGCIMGWLFGEYKSEVRNCVSPATSTYTHEELLTPEGIRAVWDSRSRAKREIANASDAIIRATEIANGTMTSDELVDDILQHIKHFVSVKKVEVAQ
jgi:hypothetical protein|tara:strand:- start:7702 stop:8556 length:855 start_codon:yes stop_codon:yes gene_type:complete